MLRLLGKASFINGSQFVIAWISPKGEVDVYASEMLQSAVAPTNDAVLRREQLSKEAKRVKGELARRWEDIARLEAAGQAPTMEDEDEAGAAGVEAEEDDEVEEADETKELKAEDFESFEGEDDFDPDQTLVEEDIALQFAKGDLDFTPLKPITTSTPFDAPPAYSYDRSPSTNLLPASLTPSHGVGLGITCPATPQPSGHTITLSPSEVEGYYSQRFSALQQATCKLVTKAWIKIIEPKKQMRFPYKNGEGLKPTWWPEGVRHREPDHLSKTGECQVPKS